MVKIHFSMANPRRNFDCLTDWSITLVPISIVLRLRSKLIVFILNIGKTFVDVCLSLCLTSQIWNWCYSYCRASLLFKKQNAPVSSILIPYCLKVTWGSWVSFPFLFLILLCNCVSTHGIYCCFIYLTNWCKQIHTGLLPLAFTSKLLFLKIYVILNCYSKRLISTSSHSTVKPFLSVAFIWEVSESPPLPCSVHGQLLSPGVYSWLFLRDTRGSGMANREHGCQPHWALSSGLTSSVWEVLLALIFTDIRCRQTFIFTCHLKFSWRLRPRVLMSQLAVHFPYCFDSCVNVGVFLFLSGHHSLAVFSEFFCKWHVMQILPLISPLGKARHMLPFVIADLGSDGRVSFPLGFVFPNAHFWKITSAHTI